MSAAAAAVIALTVGITAAVVGGRNDSVPSATVSKLYDDDDDDEEETKKKTKTETQTEAQTVLQTEKPAETTADAASYTEEPVQGASGLSDDDLVYMEYSYGESFDSFVKNNNFGKAPDEDFYNDSGIRYVEYYALTYAGYNADLRVWFTPGYGLVEVKVVSEGDHRDEFIKNLTDSFDNEPYKEDGDYYWDIDDYITVYVEGELDESSNGNTATALGEYKPSRSLNTDMFMRGHEWGETPEDFKKTEGIKEISDYIKEETYTDSAGNDCFYILYDNVYLFKDLRSVRFGFTKVNGVYKLDTFQYYISDSEYKDAYSAFSDMFGASSDEASDGWVHAWWGNTKFGCDVCIYYNDDQPFIAYWGTVS